MARRPPDPYFVLRSHLGAVTALCFMEEEQSHFGQGSVPSYVMDPCLLSGSDVGEIFVWNLKINRIACKLQQPDKKTILWLHYFQGRILSQIREVGIKIWNYISDDWIVTGAVSVEEVGFCSSSFSSSHSSTYIIVPGPQTSCMSIINFDTCEMTSVLEPSEISHGMCMCIRSFMLNGRFYVLCGYENGSILLWDCVNCSTVSKLSCHNEPVMCLDFDENHKQSGVSGSAEDHLLVWKLDDKLNLLVKEKIKLTNPGVSSIRIRPDGKIVIVGCWDSSVRLFSWRTLKPLAVLQFHSGTINCLNFSTTAIGKHKNVFAAGSKDKNISLWSLY